MLSLLVIISLVTCATTHLLFEDLPQLNERIVGGQNATITQFPYQVSLQLSNRHYCGGTIFKPNIIISAAHCVVGQSISRLSVVAGTSSRTDDGTRIAVKNITTHPEFSARTLDYDVAVLVLEKDLMYSDSIKGIGLVESQSEVAGGQKGLVSGWGVLEESGSLADTLQYISVSIFDTDKCVEAYKNYTLKITERMMCAGDDESGGIDSCQGDSGGPLVVKNKLAGIVSWGEGCARSEYPGVYSSVAVFREWIEENASATDEPVQDPLVS